MFTTYNSFTVPDGVNGAYDVYLTIGKSLSADSSALLGFSLNNESARAFPPTYQVGGDSPAAMNSDGEYDVGLFTGTGRFLIKQSVALKFGHTITISGMYGSRSAVLASTAFPNVGDILLVKPGVQIATGYDNTVAMDEDETMFYLSFPAFGADQMLYGTIDGETVNVEHDEYGFFKNDAPAMLSSVRAEAWQKLV